MFNKTFTVINKDGSLQSVPYIKVGKKLYVSEHISREEIMCPDCGLVKIFRPTIELFEETRKLVGKPIIINSGCRCQKHQDYLRKKGYKAARYSPHQEGAALDLALPNGMSAIDLAAVIKKAAKNLNLPVPRIGMKEYNYRFVHTDLVFMLFKPYTSTLNPVSYAWVEGAQW